MFDPRPPWWRVAIFVVLIIIDAGLLIDQLTKPSDYMIGSQAVAYVRDQTSPRTIAVRWDIRAGYERDKYFLRISLPFLRNATIANTDPLPSDAVAFIESDDPRAAEARAEFVRYVQAFRANFEHEDFAWHKEHSVGLERHISGVLIEEVDYVAVVKRWMAYAFTIVVVAYLAVWYVVYASIKSRTRRVLDGLCPSCSYNTAGVVMEQCPECGLNVLREAKLLRLLRQKGYRGLKLFMKEEIAPT